MTKALTRTVALLAATTLVASCAQRRQEVATVTPPAVPLPDLTAQPGALPINRGIGPGETLWHVRAALNVAALACTAPAYAAMTPQYNAMLKRHDTALTAAYKEEEDHYRQQHGAGWQDAFDRHQTALYNVFADPRATQALCGQALSLSGQMTMIDTAQLPAFASRALADLEAPVALAKARAVTAFNPTPAAPQP